MSRRQPDRELSGHRRRIHLADQREQDAERLYQWRSDHELYVRACLGIVLIGTAAIVAGVVDSMQSAGASAEPVPTDLAALEAGAPPPDKHVRIGPHAAVYRSGVFEWDRPRGRSVGLPGKGDEVKWFLYPVLSPEHAYKTRIRELTNPEADAPALLRFAPGSPLLPHPERVAMFVKTDRFATVGSLPSGTADEAGVEGLLIDGWNPGGEAGESLARRFPDLRLGRVLVLSEGRRPTSTAASVGILLGGIVVAAAGLAGFAFVRRRRPPAAEVRSTRPSRRLRRR